MYVNLQYTNECEYPVRNPPASEGLWLGNKSFSEQWKQAQGGAAAKECPCWRVQNYLHPSIGPAWIMFYFDGLFTVNIRSNFEKAHNTVPLKLFALNSSQKSHYPDFQVSIV